MLWLTGDKVLGESSAGEPGKETRSDGSDKNWSVCIRNDEEKHFIMVINTCNVLNDGLLRLYSLPINCLAIQKVKWIPFKTISDMLLLWLSWTVYTRSSWEFEAARSVKTGNAYASPEVFYRSGVDPFLITWPWFNVTVFYPNIQIQ